MVPAWTGSREGPGGSQEAGTAGSQPRQGAPPLPTALRQEKGLGRGAPSSKSEALPVYLEQSLWLRRSAVGPDLGVEGS